MYDNQEKTQRDGIEEALPLPSIIREVRHQDGASIVEVEGDVDLATFPQLREALAEAAQNSQSIIIDLSRVHYMDSTGFGALLGANKKLRLLGGSLHLVGTNSSIARMLQITRLNTIFTLHGTEASALDAVKAESQESRVAATQGAH